MEKNVMTPPYSAAALLDAIEQAQSQGLCPNRLWQSGGRFGNWHQELWRDLQAFCANLPEKALAHEDHSACTLDYCEFSSRNFTAVRQFHEGYAFEDEDQEQIMKNHTEPAICFPVQGLFDESALIKAVECGRLTPWSLDGLNILQHPRPFMAISHVWSDGTGAGSWHSRKINFCLYKYFRDIAERYGCEGIWWDTLCVPQDRATREKALGIMDMNYAYARCTLVHDRFLRNLPFKSPNQACFALVTSAWFTRGWTALELSQSRKVKVVFSDSIQDLDHDILEKAGNHAAQIIRNLRNKKFVEVEDLLSALAGRHTSWPKDRAKVAGLLAKIPPNPSQDRETWQRDIYQDILRSIGKLSHGHLFHKAATMGGGFGWCPTNIFELPQTDMPAMLSVKQDGDLEGIWSVAELDEKLCREVLEKAVWVNRHPLLEENVRQAIQKGRRDHLLLAVPSSIVQDSTYTSGIRKAVIVKLMKARNSGDNLKCRFVGALELRLSVFAGKITDRILTIGDTNDWAELGEHELAWQCLANEAKDKVMVQKHVDLSISSREQGLNASVSKTSSELSKDPKKLQRDVNFDESCHWTELHRAAWLGNEDFLFDSFDALNQQDSRGQLALHLASERGYSRFVETLLRDDTHSIDVSDSNGQKPLHRAAWGGSLGTVSSIASLDGVIIDGRDDLDRTALHLAASMGFDQVVSYLCTDSANRAVDLVNLETKHGLTALHYASMRGTCQAVRLLLDAGAEVTVANNIQLWTPLHMAADHGHASVVDLLLSKGADVEHSDVSGWTALHLAAMSGHCEVASILSRAQPELIRRQDQQGWSPINFALINGHSAVFNKIFKPHISAEKMSLLSDGMQQALNTIIQRRTGPGDLKRVKRWQGLLDFWEPKTNQTSSKVTNKLAWTCMHLAAVDGQSVTRRFLLSPDDGYNNKPLALSFSPLHFAVQHSLYGTIGLFIQLGASPQELANAEGTRSEKGWTPLQKALYNADTLMVRFLIANGADCRTRNERLRTLMGWMAECGLARSVQILLGTGKVDPDDSDLVIEGRPEAQLANMTPLSMAAYYGHEKVVRLLLATKRVRLAPTTVDRSPLSYAVERGQEPIVKLMLRAYKAAGVLNASLNDVDPNLSGHDTPLMIAAKKGYDGIAKLLLHHGASINAGTKSGYPVFYAAAEGHANIIKTLYSIDGLRPWDGNLDVGRVVHLPSLLGRPPIRGPLSWSPIFVAAYRGHESVVRLLVAHPRVKGHTLERDEYGRSPLSYAAMFGYEGIVRALLDSCLVVGIIDLKDFWGHPARWYAYKSGFGRIVELLDEKSNKGSWRLSLATRGQGVFKTEVGRLPCYLSEDLIPLETDDS